MAFAAKVLAEAARLSLCAAAAHRVKVTANL